MHCRWPNSTTTYPPKKPVSYFTPFLHQSMLPLNIFLLHSHLTFWSIDYWEDSIPPFYPLEISGFRRLVLPVGNKLFPAQSSIRLKQDNALNLYNLGFIALPRGRNTTIGCKQRRRTFSPNCWKSLSRLRRASCNNHKPSLMLSILLPPTFSFPPTVKFKIHKISL